MLRILLLAGLLITTLGAAAPQASAGTCPPGHYDLLITCFCPPIDCGSVFIIVEGLDDVVVDAAALRVVEG